MGRINDLFSDSKAETVQTIDEGKYTGKIVGVTRDTETYDYTRYEIDIDGKDTNLSVSYPTRVTFTEDGQASSQHANFLTRLGYDYTANDNFADFIVGMVNDKVPVQFLVEHKTNTKGTFAQIIRDSVKPK